jgi:CheY-like chemotaxis protein
MARVLIVEDNPQNLKLTTVILRSAGHSVVGARTAGEAEAAIAEGVPDLVLMDIALPGQDGYALTRALRARPATAQLPILAVSSFAMPGDAERALEAGCTAYLTKPIRRIILVRQVEALLGTPPPAKGGPPPKEVDSASAAPSAAENPSPPRAAPRAPEGIA